MTAGRDSVLNVWKFNDEGNESGDMIEYHYDITSSQLKHKGILETGSISRAKWLEENIVVLALSDGSVQFKDLRIPKTEKAVEMTQRRDCALWDLALWKGAEGINVVCAEDSGKVIQIDPRNNKDVILLAVRI